MILGTGVCGNVVQVGDSAMKTVKLEQIDIDNIYNLTNYKKIPIPPPRNCDLPKFYEDGQPCIPGINPWRELRLLELCKGIPGVVQLKNYTVDVDKKELKLYMEIAGNKKLTKDLPMNILNNIYNTLIDTINELNDRNILHLDIKPKNIVLDDNNNPTIVDFGWGLYKYFPMQPDELEYFYHNEQTDYTYLDEYFKILLYGRTC